MALIDDLRAAVAEQDNVNDSAVELVNKLADLVEAQGAEGLTPEAVRALVADIRANSASLSAAVLENTPQDPAPEPEPTPEPAPEA